MTPEQIMAAAFGDELEKIADPRKQAVLALMRAEKLTYGQAELEFRKRLAQGRTTLPRPRAGVWKRGKFYSAID